MKDLDNGAYRDETYVAHLSTYPVPTFGHTLY